MKCELCSMESDHLKLLHLENYNIEAHLCPECYSMVLAGYMKDEKPDLNNRIEKPEDTVYVDQDLHPLPQGVPKFKITNNQESHVFGLMSYKKEAEDYTRWYYRAIEIYPQDHVSKSAYTNEYQFSTYPSEGQEKTDERRIKAYQQLKENTASEIACKTLDKGTLSDTGMVKIEDDHLVIDGQSYTTKDLNQYLTDRQGQTLNYSFSNESSNQIHKNTVFIPEDIDDNYFYNELFDIVITFSAMENYIPSDNVQKFSLFYRKLLKKLKKYMKIRPEDGYLQSLMMMDLLNKMTSEDEYFPELCKNELIKVLHTY